MDEKYRAACRIKDDKKRFRAIQEICRNIKLCRTKDSKKKKDENEEIKEEIYHDGCGAMQPLRYSIHEKLNIQIEFEEEREAGADRKSMLSPEDVINIFKQISYDDCKVIGLNPGKLSIFYIYL